MIKAKIQFDCTWPKANVQKLFDKLINAAGITELGLSMIFVPDKPELIEEEDHTEIIIPKPKHIEINPLKPIDVPWPKKEEPPKQAKPDSNTFTEIERISGKDLGHVMGTSKQILTYAETKDGRVTIFYNEAPMYTTFETVRALPEKIPVDMVRHLSGGKRAALRGFKKWLTAQDALKEEEQTKYPDGIDPYAPILTGGGKVDTHTSGKVEGDLQ